MKKCYLIGVWALVCLQTLIANDIVYPPDLKAIVDVTQPPYSVDNTGQTDCTEGIIRAIDDVMRLDVEALENTRKLFEAYPDTQVSFESRKGRIIFPHELPPSRIIYFPKGTYLVSNTLTYTFQDHHNTGGAELNRCLHFMGENREKVIIKLKDNADGFGKGQEKAVVSFIHETSSNVAMQNTFENMTIDIGAGNPGAIGLIFYANNTGAVRDVTIRSSDPDRAGHTGFGILHYNSSCAFVKNLLVNGFDYGVRVESNRLYSVFEHITVQNQHITGFYLKDNNISVRGLKSRNRVPALTLDSQAATLAVVDCEFSGGSSENPAIDLQSGFLFARNIQTSGYRAALVQKGGRQITDDRIDEFVSHAPVTLLPDENPRSLNLKIEETPDIPWPKVSEWVSVNSFGAKGDGKTDDTKAIQKALSSGSKVLYFQPGRYLINGKMTIPATVERINFMYCDFVAGKELKEMLDQGAFKIVGESKTPLIMEDAFAFEQYYGKHYFIEHASTRTLIVSDIQTQIGAMYINTVPGGKVFLENVACTDEVEPNRNGFTFRGQQVWARQFNPERGYPQALNDGSDLWVLGFKTEGGGTAYHTTGGGRTEVLGGIFNMCRQHRHGSTTTIVNDNSFVSIMASTTDHRELPDEPHVMIEEIRDGISKKKMWNEFPFREEQLIVVPLYVGREVK